jgi:glutamate--cysteine ligase
MVTTHARELAAGVGALSASTLKGLRRGIEKESLRVRADGALSMAAHPVRLGSALTHPNVTTDFSEAQLELITGVHDSAADCLAELTSIHQVVYRAIGDELLWCASMPGDLPADDEIPIGRYGTSNVGRAKTIYRTGLSHRYGAGCRRSPASITTSRCPRLPSPAYFALIRNFRRYSWLLLYLFGASPAVCASFVAGRAHELQRLSDDTFYLPHATSLRMGRLGYQSDAQSSLAVSYNNPRQLRRLAAAGAHRALSRLRGARHPRRRRYYRQLATSLLQMENEFYGTIRPKRTIHPGERPLHALRDRGVEYVEVRLMDLDPFHAVGIAGGHDALSRHVPAPLPAARECSRHARRARRGRSQQAARGRRGARAGLMLLRGRRRGALGRMGRRDPCRVRAHRGRAGRGNRRQRASRRAGERRRGARRSRCGAVRTRACRDGARPWKLPRAVRARAVAPHRDAILDLPLAADTAARFARLASESLVPGQI